MNKSKISASRAQMPLDLGCGLGITLGEAAKILNTTSRTALYRWYKHGIDNEPAKQLLTLHASKRVIPNIPVWRGYHFDAEHRLVTPLDEPLSARQIEQLRWFISAWYDNMSVVKTISENIRTVANESTEFHKRKYQRLSVIFRKKLGVVTERLAMERLKSGILEDVFIKKPQSDKRGANVRPKLTLVKSPSN